MSPKPIYKFDKKIANYIEKCIKGGVSVKMMLASMQGKFASTATPSNMATLYKVYGSHMESVRAELVESVASVVIKQAVEGHFPSQDLFLRSKGGWSTQTTVNENELDGDPDEDEGAIDALMAKLGKPRVSDIQEE